ncbi:MAG: hypothetical protein MR465_06050 [Bacilli bacterium]|nr:hypothetical protein [Bacilli bacterium]
MKNKSRIRIILIALLVIVISLSVGFGTWIISNYVNSKPNDGVNKVITRYLDSKTAVYDGNVLLPSSKEIGTVGDFGNEDISYYFSTDNGNTYNKCINDSTNSVGPINAGSYLIKVEYTLKYKDTDGNDQEKVYTKDGITFEIRPFKINSSNTKYSILGEYEYTGSEIKPNLVLTTTISSSKVFTLTSNDYSITGATNASTNATATITGKGNYEGTIQINYVINKKHISLVKKTYEIEYNSTSRDAGKWSNFSSQLKNLIEFIDKNGNSITVNNDQYDVGIYDGTFGYGLDESKNNNSLTLILKNIDISTCSNGINVSEILSNATKKYEYVIGSTYEIQVKITSDNYLLDNSSLKNILKYKTTLVNGKYYTIEEAMTLSSGTITFPGDASSVGTFVYTSFTNLETTPYGKYNFTLNNRTLLLPFENSLVEKSILSTKTGTSYGNVYSALYIPKQVSIYVENSAKISICAEIGYNLNVSTTLVQKHGVIYNDGNIIFNESTYLYSYGYIKGKGRIEMKNDSLCMALFSVHDFPGGSAASSMYTKVLVTNSWTFHTISCELFLYSGCQYQSFFHVVLSDTDCDASPILVGKGDKKDQNCLFIPNEIKSSNYLRLTSSPAISWKTKNEKGYLHYSLINGCNQIIGQRDQIEINGEYNDSTFSMEITGYKKVGPISIPVNVKFNTSTSISATIGLADVVINENSSLILTKSSYLFLPGSKMEIKKGGKLEIGTNVNLSFTTITELNSLYPTKPNCFQNKSVDHDDAVLNIAGEITLDSSGCIGGKIIATDENARLFFASGTLSTSYNIYYDTNSPYYKPGTATAKGSIDNVDGNFTSGSYVSTINANGDGFTWISESNVTIYNVSFYDGDTLITTIQIQVLSGNTYEIKSTIFDYDKLFYKLNADNPWLQTINGISAIGIDISTLADSNNNLNLYANWVEKTYSIMYTASYGKTSDGSINYISQDDPNLTYTNLLSTFTISDFVNNVLQITTIPSYTVDGVVKNFKGFYIGIDDSVNQLISEITLNQFKKFIDTYGETQALPLYFKFVDVEQVSIEYDATYDGVNNVTHNDAVSTRGTSELVDSGSTIYLPDLSDVTKANLVNNNTYLYYFVGWQLEGDPSITYLPEEAFNAIQGTKFVSVWKLKEITLTINHDENTSTTEYYKEGSIIDKMSEPTRTGYKFNGFTLDGITEDAINNKWTFIKNNPTITINWLKYFSIFIIEEEAKVTIEKTKAVKGEFIEFTVSYYKNNNKKTTANGVSLNGVSTGTSFSFTMPENDVTITAHSEESCVLPDTLITMADGTYKRAEDIVVGDIVMAFNHETGRFEPNVIIINEHSDQPATWHTILNLKFSDNTLTRICGEQGFFDVTLNKYIYITTSNYEDFIGHQFYGVKSSTDLSKKIVTLESCYLTEEFTKVYSPDSARHFNILADNMLQMPALLDGLFNIFEYDSETLQFDQAKMQEDIEKYGLLSYDDFKDILPYEVYLMIPAEYLKVSIGKGYITWDIFYSYVDLWLDKLYRKQ